MSCDNTILVELRNQNIQKYIAAQTDVLYAKWANPSVNFRYVVSPDFSLTTKPTDYSFINRLGMVSRGSADAKAAIKRAQSGDECDTTQAPSCTDDRDCVVWAAHECVSAKLAMSGRCLVAGATDGTSNNNNKCSFNATEVAEHRAARVTRSDADGTCLSVAFSGGGDRGAYEAGVLRGLADNVASGADIEWQVSSGVSVGSIVSTGLAKFPIGQESAAADFAVDAALGVTADIIFNNWTKLVPFIGPEGIVRGLFFESGLFDSSAERKFLEGKFDSTPLDPSENYRTHTLLATDMATGEGKHFEFTGSVGTKALIDALMATSAIQGAFPMQVGR